MMVSEYVVNAVAVQITASDLNELSMLMECFFFFHSDTRKPTKSKKSAYGE